MLSISESRFSSSRDGPSCSWHEPSFKGPFQDGLPQHAAAGEAGSDSGFDLIEDGEAVFDFLFDSQLFKAWWKGESKIHQLL